jgi:hypothetical protein
MSSFIPVDHSFLCAILSRTLQLQSSELPGSTFAILVLRTNSHWRRKTPEASVLSSARGHSSGKISVRLSCITHPHSLYLYIVDAANDIQPPPYPNLPKGVPGAGYEEGVIHLVDYDVSKAARILGIGSERKYITKEQCTRDSIRDFVSRGWKP